LSAIDLNGDAGEIPEALADGREEAFLASLTSASVACGGHAGTAGSMEAMTELCRRLGVRMGAHPSYPDRANFGRIAMPLDPGAVEDEVARQIEALGSIARARGVALRHLKPHGALYHDCAARAEIAQAVARAAARWSRELVLYAAAGSPALERWAALGFTVAAEAFADRVYEPDGTLRSRSLHGAVIESPAAAAAQALAIVARGEVVASDGSVLALRADSICVHGDTRGAAAIARAVRAALRDPAAPGR
jgi:UPF0271 protein